MISYFFSKGIDKVDINDCITEITEENLNWERDSAKIFIKKKRLILDSEHKNKNLSKMARAGFSYDISKEMLETN